MQTYIATISLALAGFSYGSPTSVSNRRFVSGGCNVHVTQWQKNENGVGGAYQFDVRVTDAIGAIIGGANRLTIGDFTSADVASQLPYLVVISAGAVDEDPVQFAYAGSQFSSSHGCSTGGYEDGNRDMDCGFTC
ncbi:hypothetical protein FHL15_000747 [Xylaria flabelliformis]|uniref:Uncharacterized protein n=1 Tax=Xylaria flabelliformis TaxID=2512241 RepID=A0A553ID21_9PEZI|nr:hypothetical protein FHL15_000747 [Xylaria flabelliformis]